MKPLSSITFKLDKDYKEYRAGKLVDISLQDDYIMIYQEGGINRYKIKCRRISGVYMDAQRLYITYNLSEGGINTLQLKHDSSKKTEIFVQSLKNTVNHNHAEGVVM